MGVEGIEPCGSFKEIDFDGDIIRNKFMDIWNNNWYANMRYRLLTGNPPKGCMNCNDPSVKDVNHIGSYFDEKIFSELSDYIKNKPQLSQETQLIDNMLCTK